MTIPCNEQHGTYTQAKAPTVKFSQKNSSRKLAKKPSTTRKPLQKNMWTKGSIVVSVMPLRWGQSNLHRSGFSVEPSCSCTKRFSRSGGKKNMKNATFFCFFFLTIFFTGKNVLEFFVNENASYARQRTCVFRARKILQRDDFSWWSIVKCASKCFLFIGGCLCTSLSTTNGLFPLSGVMYIKQIALRHTEEKLVRISGNFLT